MISGFKTRCFERTFFKIICLFDVHLKHFCFLNILSVPKSTLLNEVHGCGSGFPTVLFPVALLFVFSVGYINEADIIAHIAGLFFFFSFALKCCLFAIQCIWIPTNAK